MTAILPRNRIGLPAVESRPLAGLSPGNYRSSAADASHLLGGNATFTGPYEDWTAYGEVRLQALADVASAAGGVHIDWSLDGVTQHATEIAGSAAAGVLYDSGAIPVRMQYGRVRWVNGAGAQASFALNLTLGLGVPSSATARLRAMAVCTPGFNAEFDEYTTLTNSAASATIYTVPAGVIDGMYWVRVPRDGSGNEQKVRLHVGTSTVKTAHQSSNEERVALGPLQGGDLITYWRDCGAGIVIQFSRIS